MKILAITENSGPSGFELFLQSVSGQLAAAICKKLQGYSAANAVYTSNSLKILKPGIWGYKGTIYKLRVDCGKESARILFARSAENDLVLLHGFVKKTQKTPAKDAKIAMDKYQRVQDGVELTQLPVEKHSS